jgi:hypothetical protein
MSMFMFMFIFNPTRLVLSLLHTTTQVLNLKYSNAYQQLADGIFIAKKSGNVSVLRHFVSGIVKSMLPCHGCGVFDAGTSGA